MIKKLPKECYEDDYNNKLNEVIEAINFLISALEKNNVLKRKNKDILIS